MIEHGMGQRMVRMELKYCERCGGLLIRRSGEAVVYCGPCDDKIRDLPAATTAKRAAQVELMQRAQTTEQRACAGLVRHLEAVSAMRIPPQSERFPTAKAAQRRQA
ncbi:MAG TPA: hypothetical protein VD837_13205 [Terriglobales bacterium]|nr:hypothetical protein [Terriglobales bacterium]